MLLILFSLLVTSFGQHFDGSNHCVDLSSNCVKRQSLCQNALFEDLMREQCRKTCNFCDDDPDGAPIDATDEDTFIEEQSVEETTPGSFEEIDSAVEEPEVGPEPEPIEYSTRAPAYSKKIDACLDRSHDCASKRHLCIRPEYRTLMIRSCAKTCGYCGTGSQVSRGRHINTPYPHSRVNKPYPELVCRDTSYDCPNRAHLCQNPKYLPLVQKLCRKTCNFC